MNSPKLIIFIFLSAIIAFSAFLNPAWSAPEPSLVPAMGTWQLDIELHSEPKLITITLPGDTQPRRFWYLLYTITNNTASEIEFYPQFALFTDTFKLYSAGVKVRRPAFDAIRELYRSTIPLLEPEDRITGRILLGRDNARDSVAIFEDFDPNATMVKMFVSGLSNETVSLRHPDGENKNPKQVLLRKTLMLQYQVPGDRFSPAERVMLYRSRKWIMR